MPRANGNSQSQGRGRMRRRIFLGTILLFAFLRPDGLTALQSTGDLSNLKNDERIADFRVANLFSDEDGGIVGAKFRHIPTGAPVYFLQIETVPQAYMWIDTPTDSSLGLPHSLEHLLAGKGTKGRYVSLLRD